MPHIVNQLIETKPVRTSWLRFTVIFSVVAHISVGSAQAPTPPITSSGLNTRVSSPVLVGGETQYDITGGTRAGTNLFHSFGSFNVPNNSVANFLNDANLATENILGRVTGGNPSSIFGLIQTTGFGSANLFLMNPSGIVFGPTASLNVGGSVSFTTADYLRLEKLGGLNAGIFHADLTQASLLSSAPVDAYGFLGVNPGAITIQGSQLTVPGKQEITLVGGNIAVQNGILVNGTNQPTRLLAPNGQINMASTQSPGELQQNFFDGPNIDGQLFTSLGTIRLASGSRVDVSQTANGKVSIRGGQLVLEIQDSLLSTIGNATSTPITPGQDTILLGPTSEILSGANSESAGPDIHLRADRIAIVGVPSSIENFSQKPFTGIQSYTLGVGKAGDIALRTTRNIELNKLSAVSSSTEASGQAGNIELTSAHGNIFMIEGGKESDGVSSASIASGDTGNVIVSAPEGSIILSGVQVRTQTRPINPLNPQQLAAATGRPGQVEIIAKNLEMRAGTLGNFTTGPDQPGGITVNLSGTLTMAADPSLNLPPGGLPDSIIVSSSVSRAPSGDISIAAKDILISQKGIVNSSSFSSGPGGHLRIITDTLNVVNGAQISSGSTRAPNRGSLRRFVEGLPTGPGGDVTIEAKGAVVVDGAQSGVFTDTEGTGAGGSINLLAKTLTIQNGGTVSASTTGITPRATGGSIIANATDQVTLHSGGTITASTSGPGDAGNVTIRSDQLTIASGGRIEASTSGTGKGGSIGITTTGDVTVAGLSADGQVRSGIYAKTLSADGGSGSGGSGKGSGAGNGAAANPGKAGDITIEAKNLLLNRGAQIDSSTTSGGAGGSVSIRAAENITIAGSSTRLTSDATRGNGKGGSLTLVAKNITVRDNASVTAATGGKGDAGDISLTALDQLLLQSAGTVTTSTSGSGKGGTIVIQANQVLLDGQGTRISADTLPPFADMIITIKILHPNVGDLVVQLESPTGTRVALLSRVGGSGAHFIDTQLNDRASTQITSGSAPFTGTFTPREPLGQLNNELVAGNWALNVRDQTNGNQGSLESWTLQIGQQTFQSTGRPIVIPDNVSVRSTITVTNPTVPTVQGVGETPGIGGNIVLTAGQSVTVSNGASVSASSTGPGNAGTISINAGQQLDVLNGSITTQAAKASGGNIDIRAIDRIRLVDSTISTSVLGGDGTGGNIFIDPKVVILQGSNVTAQAVGGTGGQIKFVTPLFLADSASIVSAQSQRGPNGTVTIQSPTSNLSGTVGQLVSKMTPPQVLLQSRCVALTGGGQSTFIVAGREKLPAEPGGWLNSPISMDHWIGENQAHAAGLMVQSRGSNVPRARNIPKDEPTVFSLRRLTPPGFLVRAFASPSTDCPS